MKLTSWVEWLPDDELSGALAAAAFREMAATPEWDPCYDTCLEALTDAGRVDELREARVAIASASIPRGPDGAADAVLAAVTAQLALGRPGAEEAAALLVQPLERARLVRERLSRAGGQGERAAMSALASLEGPIERLA